MSSPHGVFLGLLLATLNQPALAAEATSRATEGPTDVIAINILLLPDANMTAAAEALNARVRASDSAGFSFDATHIPHISLLHRFIRKGDLGEVQSAVARTIAQFQPVGWRLRATQLECTPWNGRSVASIAIERTPDLARLQSELMTALAPMAVERGGARAFVQLPNEPEPSATTVDYVRTFVPKATGENFKPHITAGIGARDTVEKICAGPFPPMKFDVSAVAIFQLGDVGTARKVLWKSTERQDVQ